jgi:hypothetical protein
MFRLLAAIVVVVVSSTALAEQVPEFAKYLVSEISTTKVTGTDLSVSHEARLFKTSASKTIGQTANFAGHYVVVTQGCGTSCQAVALVDVLSGKVYPANFSAGLGTAFKVNSRLLIDSPPENIKEFYGSSLPPLRERMYYSYYYEWNENSKQFRRIYSDEPK